MGAFSGCCVVVMHSPYETIRKTVGEPMKQSDKSDERFDGLLHKPPLACRKRAFSEGSIINVNDHTAYPVYRGGMASKRP